MIEENPAGYALERADRRRRLPILLAATFAIRLPFIVTGLMESVRFRSNDSVGYLKLAKNLGAGYLDRSADLFDLGLNRTPAFPLFVLATGGTVQPIFTVVAQLLLSGLIVGLTYVIGRRYFGDTVATVAALVMALDPASAVYSALLQPETLGTVLLVAAVWLVLPRPNPHRLAFLGGGLLLGSAVLVRPIALALPIVVVPAVWFLWRHQKPMAACLAVVVGFAVPVGGWTLRNQLVAGVPTVSSILGEQLLTTGAAGAVQQERTLERVDGETYLRREVDDRAGEDANSAERSRVAADLAVRQILKHPVGMVKHLAGGAARTMGGPARQMVLTTLAGRRVGDRLYAGGPTAFPAPLAAALVVLQLAFLAVVYLGMVVGAWVLVRRRSWAMLALLVGLIAYFGLSAPGLAGHSRFRVPATPYIALLAGVGLMHLRHRRSSPETPIGQPSPVGHGGALDSPTV